MKKYILFTAIVQLAFLLSSCHPKAEIPTSSTPISKKAILYPDYTNIIIPPNIAPLNFIIQTEAESFVAAIQGKGISLCAAASDDGKIQFDSLEWKQVLHASKGTDLVVTIYAKQNGNWVNFPAYKMHVAEEKIDPYLSYRLIEPGYMLYRQLGLYQRNLTNFCETVIYENNRDFDTENNHCINCHNYQNYSTKRMLFHIRAAHGGTIIAEDGKIKKLDLKSDSIFSSSVYPTWHPTENWVVFSSNKTGQAFHLLNKEKIEVMDEGSDLVFYDVSKNAISNILKTRDELETFPCWAPTGDKLYYCSAHLPELLHHPDSMHTRYIVSHYDSIRYNVMSMTFNKQTQTFGSPTLEVNCAAIKKSASVPRISPDGRYILFTLGDFGQFHIWHKSSDLYVKDLHTGIIRPLTEANSTDVDSYHTWSSNGRWIVFSSRRNDGSYTRPYIAYFDKSGKAHKAFMLPQEDPEYNLLLLKSYNVPELTKDAVPFSPSDFRNTIYNEKAIPANYKVKR
ncbi:MAG: hypothetical protein RR386_04290 [Bacteroidaceae bacterium]